MKLASTGLTHLGLRVTHLAQTRQFYVDTLGFVPLLETPEVLICNAYGTVIAFRGDATQTPTDDRFDPFRVGLDHVALGVPSIDVLASIQQDLDRANVPNHGIEFDELTKTNYISFYDPDGIAWEIYPTSRP